MMAMTSSRVMPFLTLAAFSGMKSSPRVVQAARVKAREAVASRRARAAETSGRCPVSGVPLVFDKAGSSFLRDIIANPLYYFERYKRLIIKLSF